jgi:hypothetical protein
MRDRLSQLRDRLSQLLAALERSRGISGPGVGDCIISIPEYCALKDISASTEKRQRRAGLGPPRVKLSERRRGIRLRDALAEIDANTLPPSREGDEQS